MTDDRSLERAARSWIEAGPTRAPDRTVEAALRQIDTTPQEWDLRIPRRLTKVPTIVRVAAAAAIGVLVIGGVLLIVPRSDQSVGGQPSPSGAIFESTQHGYSIELPDNWSATPATTQWSEDGPDPHAPYMDRLLGPGIRLVATSAPLGGRSPDQWKAGYAARFGLDGVGECDVLPENWPAIDVGGREAFLAGDDCQGDGTVSRSDRFFEALAFVDGRVYLFWLQGSIDRSTFDELMDTVTFDAAAANPSASAAAGQTVFDTRTIPERFALRMKVTLPVGWTPFHDITGALGLVKTGSPPGPDTTWWGPDLLLVDDAQVHDPSSVVSSEPATASLSDFVPWPADFFEYIAELPGVEVVSGPEPITVGGVTGTQIVVKTPEMHPLFWMAGDFAWLGGGRTGVDPAGQRRFILVESGGHKLLVAFAEDPSRFEERDAELQTLLDSITFE